MKSIVLAFVLFTSISFGQVYTSVQDGDFWSPLTWDCTCFPQDGDSLVINHDVTLSSGIAYQSGQIYIGASGSLDQGANNFSFYIVAGSLINYGTLTIDDLLLDSLGFIQNFGTANLDSVWTRAAVWNEGTINTTAMAHDEFYSFFNVGEIMCTGNFYNEGSFINDGIMTVGGASTNCNISTSEGSLENNGFLCIGGNFLNCQDDTLKGDGTMYIGGTSTNDGEVLGNLLINTPTGGFTLNFGNVAGTVTFGTDACTAEMEEAQVLEWNIYPNPANDILNSSEKNFNYTIHDLSGRVLMNGYSTNGVIQIDELKDGTYFISMENTDGQSTKKTFIKL